MNDILRYGVIAAVLILIELCYFLLADKFYIIDKPNERSSHSVVLLRGGGIVFLLMLSSAQYRRQQIVR